MKRILVAGIGNIFLGDDAFGVEVVRVLRNRPLPLEVTVMDFGTRGYDLAFTMLEGYAATILVDATAQRQTPGTLYVTEADLSEPEQTERPPSDGHSLTPQRVLDVVRLFGGEAGRVFVVGCEPEILESHHGTRSLSANVQAAIPHAIEIIERLIFKLLGQENQTLALVAPESNQVKPWSASSSEENPILLPHTQSQL